MKKNILITGGAGYIGSVLSAYLSDRGFTISVLDDLSVGKLINLDSRIEFYQGSILDKEILSKALENVDTVIHCAGKSVVAESVKNSDLYSMTNVIGTRNLLDAMKIKNISKIIFSSSCAVYGQSKTIPITENEECNPTNPYGESKLECDRLISSFASQGFSAISFRFFNVGGSYHTLNGKWIYENREIESHLIPTILSNLRSEVSPVKVKVFGCDWPTADGSCVRDYLHVLDLAKAHLLAMDHLTPFTHSIYNLGAAKGYSVLEVIETIENITGRPLKILELGRRLGDVAELIADTSKAKKELGWSAEHMLEDIIISAQLSLSII